MKNTAISFARAGLRSARALGVAALIIVLSVMNGFQKEVRDRMLAVIAHVEVRAPGDGALPDWRLTPGLRYERWQAWGGRTLTAGKAFDHAERELTAAIDTHDHQAHAGHAGGAQHLQELSLAQAHDKC